MPEHLLPPVAAIDEGPCLTGSPVTLLSLTAEGELVTGRNIPDAFSSAEFTALLTTQRRSGVSGRTFGDLVRHVGGEGGTAREQFRLSDGSFSARYDIDLWRQEDGTVGVLLVDVLGEDRDSIAVRTLALELAHRTKNVMAIILGLATQTGRRMPDYERFKAHFCGQVHALSTAHDIIATTGWQGGMLGTVIERCIGEERATTTVTVAPGVAERMLKPNAVQNIAIVLHELQTTRAARDSVVFDVGDAEGGGIALTWTCRGPCDPDSLWTDMLCRHAPTSLDGSGEIDRDEGGFRYRLVVGANQGA